ncbi:MAG: hypothetical protein K0A90_07695 [Methanosarcinaceae archaeon]|nr:hypothetical protein [Methanosarcinaceae archaeon]
MLKTVQPFAQERGTVIHLKHKMQYVFQATAYLLVIRIVCLGHGFDSTGIRRLKAGYDVTVFVDTERSFYNLESYAI